METQNTMNEAMQKRLDEETLEIQKEHTKKIEVAKKQSMIYGGIGGFLFLVILGAYVIPQIFYLQEVRADIDETSKSISMLLTRKADTLKNIKEIEAYRIDVEKKYGSIIPKVLPEVHSAAEYQKKINFLATFFEDFALENKTINNELAIPSVNFGKPREEGDLFIVPIQMSIEAGKDNFDKFLAQIDEKSGSINPKDFYTSSYTKENEPVPVMSIDSLSLAFPKEQTAVSQFLSASQAEESDIHSFNVSISAYFKSTPEMQQMFGSTAKKKK